MDLDLSFLKRYFKGFYNVVFVFVAITVLFFVLSYFSRLKAVEAYIYDFHNEMLTLMGQDFQHLAKNGLSEYDFYQKYNSAHLKFVDNVIVIRPDNQAFFTGNADKTYEYGGIGRNGDVTLGNIVLKDNLISTKRFDNGIEVLILTSKAFAKDFTFKEWIGERRVQFTVSILVPIIIMVFLMLIEDKVIKELQGKFYEYFQVIQRHEMEMDALYSGLFYQNNSIMLLINPETGRIVNGNEAAVSYYGYHFLEEEVFINQINTMPTNVISDLMAEAMAEKRNYFNFQHRLKNGMIRDVEVYAGSVFIKGEEVLCSVVHDVTDKIRAEQELLNQKLEMENNIKEKTEILATISHEIKTPVAAVIHNIQDLSQRVKEPEIVKQLQFLKLNIDSLNRLVFDLLDYSRIDAGGFKMYSTPFNLEEVLESSVMLFKPVASEKKIKLELNLDGLRRKRYVGDSFRIGQIVNNLISNSVKYTHDGKISVVAKSEPMDHQSLVSIIIEDTGIGMKPEVVEQIFKRFYTTDYSGELAGTGLGLSICRLIVEAMDGTLEVDSKEGVGTKMILTLELDNDEGTDASILVASKSAESTLQKEVLSEEVKETSVLLVDDDPMNLLFLEKMVRASSKRIWRIESAYNGLEALEMAAVEGYDYIFCDYQLPDQLGTQFFNTLKVHLTGPLPKLILMSADTVSDYAPADEFWLKPIDLSKISALVSGKVSNAESSISLRDLEGHVYLKWEEWNHLLEMIQTDETGSVFKIFTKALNDRWVTLPKNISEEEAPEIFEKILKLLHAIKGSIGYFKPEKFQEIINETDRQLRNSSLEFLDKKLVYEHFLNCYKGFMDEVKTIDILLMRQLGDQ